MTPWGEMPQVNERRDYIIACVNAVHAVGGEPETVECMVKLLQLLDREDYRTQTIHSNDVHDQLCDMGRADWQAEAE